MKKWVWLTMAAVCAICAVAVVGGAENQSLQLNTYTLSSQELPTSFDGFRIGNTAMTMRTVPEGSFFVLGDNLPESTDSRDVTVGMVREEDILGKVILEW